MKVLAQILFTAGLLLAQGGEGNFTIRLEPRVVLQANIDIPFEVRVLDDRRKPLVGATVTLQIENPDGHDVRVFKAAGMEPGVYVAKPVFPSAGQWSVYVEVHRAGEMSARTVDYSVPDRVTP